MAEIPTANFCDCHVHVVGPRERYPQLAGRNYTAAPAALTSLRAAAEPFGVTRFVVVQPSFYGSDNRCLFDALETLGECGRGVVVIDPEDANRGLFEDYTRRGACGVRVNLYSNVGTPAMTEARESVRRLMTSVPQAGWHVEIIAPLAKLVVLMPLLAGSPVPVVIDHYGLPGQASPESHEGRCLLDLARMPHVWMKLTAPYRLLSDRLGTQPPTGWLAALLRAAPDRCVWGSDWPHTPPQKEQTGAEAEAPYRKLNYGRVLGDFLNVVPDVPVAKSLLVKNPGRLYGFAW